MSWTQALRIPVIAAVLIAALPTTAWSATLEKIRSRGFMEVCVSPDAMPFSRGPSPVEGFDIDLATAVAKQLGVGVNFSWVTFRYEARYTNCDAFMNSGVLPGGGSRLKKSTPILAVEALVVSLPGRNIAKRDDFNGLRVALQSGSMAHAKLLDAPVDIRVSHIGDEKVLDALRRGEVDAGIVTNIGLGWYQKRNPDVEFRSVSASFLHTPTGYPIAIGLRQSDDATLKEFNDAIAALDANGQLLAIKARFGLDAQPK